MAGEDPWHDRYSRQTVLEPIGEEGQRRLGGVRIHLFPTGRALMKGTGEVATAKSLCSRYVGN